MRAWKANRSHKVSLPMADGRVLDALSVDSVVVCAETKEEAAKKLKARGCSDSAIANMIDMGEIDTASVNYG